MKPILSKNLKSQLEKVLWITVAWTIVSLFQYLNGYAALLEQPDAVISDQWIPFKVNLIAGILAGVMGGTMMVFFWEKWLRTKSYGWTLKTIFITYLVLFLIVYVIASLIFQGDLLNLSVFSREIWVLVFARLIDPATLIPFMYWLAIVLTTMIALLVNDKYGPGVFKNFLLGKYFHPKREERIFMFLDLRSSTTIAEKLGEERYFKFLKDVHAVVTGSILNSNGQIYQYVGDEIVISWSVVDGIKNANCIRCFLDVQKSLLKKADYFLSEYEIRPEYKAGLHYGHVMAGEVGVVKREIAFSGDVLNTTSRIQGKCNELGVDILASKFLIDKLNLSNGAFHPKKIGEMELRGKKELVTLFTI